MDKSKKKEIVKMLLKNKEDIDEDELMELLFDQPIAVDVDKMALPPCHTMFQFFVINNKLSCQLYQRSADCFLGVPFNIASYSLLTMMLAQVCNLELGDFVHTTGDTHIYLNHIDQVKLQLSREPYPLPKIKINPEIKDIFSFDYSDFELVDYISHPSIKAEVAVWYKSIILLI